MAMQTLLPTSRFSQRKPVKPRPVSHAKSPEESIEHTGPHLLSFPAPGSQTSSPAHLRSELETDGEPPLRPALTSDSRLQSSGSIRKANPARYRALHPDELDPNVELGDQPSQDCDETRSWGLRRAETDSSGKEHWSPRKGLSATPAIGSQWAASSDESTVEAHAQPTPSPQQEVPLVSFLPPLVEETMDELETGGKPYQGLSDYPLDLGKSRRLIDDDYLKSAFGITMSRRDSEEHVRRERSGGKHDAIPAVPPLPKTDVVASPYSERSEFFEMDVPLTLDPRVILPPQDSEDEDERILIRSEPSAMDGKASSDSDEPTSTTSSASTLKQARLAQQLQGGSATAVAIISPDQVLESPKPRRPFSTVSIEGMTSVQSKKALPEQPIKSTASNSSEDTNAQDMRSSEHSTGSSMSSVASPLVNFKVVEHEHRPAQPRPTYPANDPPTSTVSHEPLPLQASTDMLSSMGEMDDTTSMYHNALTSRSQSRNATSTKRPIGQPEGRRQNSNVSPQGNYAMNINKPLPPEPGRTMPHISEQSSSSRTAGNIIRPEHQQHQRSRAIADAALPKPTRPSVNMHRIDSRSSTLSGWSLRSKYSPKDLDALDNAFVQRDGARGHSQQSPVASIQTSPRPVNQSQLSLQDAHLGVIREASPPVARPQEGFRYHKASSSDPSQRSRAPARNESGRRLAQPPPSKPTSRKNSLISLYNDKGPPKQQLASQHSQNASQISGPQKPSEEQQRKPTLTVVSPSNKADRVLGKGSVEHKWARPESRDIRPAGSSHPNSAHSTNSREHFRSPVEQPVDAHFAEIQARMQLLHPKDASSEQEAPEGLTRPKGENAGGSNHWKRVTPLAELPAQLSPQPVEALNSRRVERDPSSSAKQGRGLQFVPPPPPPPPLSETPPPVLDRRGRLDGREPLSSISRSTASQRSTKARSIASLVASEIPEIYACLPSNATNSLRPSMTAEEAEQMISAEAAERVLYRILQHLHSFRDLFAAAQVSRGFYRTFKRHELSLLKSALYRMSPPAWELREISIPRLELLEDGTDYMPNIYFSHYMRDLATLNELKAMSLQYCQPFLRTETVRDLSAGSERQTKIDAAFWRVWTFCKIFGVGSQREHDMVGQMDWLNGGRLARQSFEQRSAALADDAGRRSILLDPPAGFAVGNGHGLNPDELYDMTEVWTCLGALVRGYLNQLDLAWEFGVFDRVNITRGDDVRENALLEEWTHYLMTRGPQAVLRAAAPTTPTADHFAHVKADGLTDWKPMSTGSSRSMFLKEALSHVYDEQMRETRPLMAASPKGFSDLPQVVSPGLVPTFPPNVVNRNSSMMSARAGPMMVNMDPIYGSTEPAPTGGPMSAPMDVSPYGPRAVPVNGPRSAPMSNFHETLSKLEAIDTSTSADGPSSKAGRSRFGGRRRAKTGETQEPRAQRMNVETVASPTSPTDSTSPLTSSPGANTFRSPTRGARLATLKGKVTGKSPRAATSAGMPKPSFGLKPSQVSLPSMPSIDDVSINTQSETLASLGSGEQLEDPMAPMIDQLIAMGFEEPKARKALNKNTKNNFIDFEQALASLVKQREIRKKMERLDRMG